MLRLSSTNIRTVNYMIYAEKNVCKLPSCGKRSGKHDIMLFDLYRMLRPNQDAMIWVKPDKGQVPYGHKLDGVWVTKPKEPHITIPPNVILVYPIANTAYRSLKRSILAAIRRLNLPLELSTVGKRPIITRLPDQIGS